MTTREAWLNSAVEALAVLFTDHAYEAPTAHVSVGFPAKGGLSTKRRVLGECWRGLASEDGVAQIHISPMIGDASEVLAVLLHELVHAWDKGEHGHKGPFIETAKDVGLVGPWTSTTAGDELKLTLRGILDTLGGYPHSKLSPAMVEKTPAKTYMLKFSCAGTKYVARTTLKWVDLYGPPICPCCETPMIGEEK